MNLMVVIIFWIMHVHLVAQNSCDNNVSLPSKKRTPTILKKGYKPKGMLTDHKPIIANKTVYTFPETKARKLKKRRTPKKNGCIAAVF